MRWRLEQGLQNKYGKICRKMQIHTRLIHHQKHTVMAKGKETKLSIHSSGDFIF